MSFRVVMAEDPSVRTVSACRPRGKHGGMRTSPLHEAHIAAGARFIEFAGWRLPVHYGSILREARAVRASAGMFDVSHMGRFALRRSDAFAALDRLGTNDLRRIGPGRAQYTAWCAEDGGTIDDLIAL